MQIYECQLFVLHFLSLFTFFSLTENLQEFDSKLLENVVWPWIGL